MSQPDNSVNEGQKKRGRKPISPEIVEKVLHLAKSNPDWGYEHIAGTMRYLGYNVSATTIRHILEANGIVPDPERRLRGDWSQFIETQQYVTAATDFAQVSAQPAPSGFESDSVVCSSTNRNNGRTAWDAKDEIIGRRNCPNIGTAV